MKQKSETKFNNKLFLGENDYADLMIRKVRPLLEENRKNGYFSSYDGAGIYYEYYEHPNEKASIVISHGLCAFTKKYEEVIFYFFQEGYSVYILDHRGHGYSHRIIDDISKVYIHCYDEYVSDLHSFITQITLKNNAHKKLVLYAHSMGGAVAALFLEKHPDIFSCAILSSPMLEINFGKTPSFAVWLFMLFKKITGRDEDYAPEQGAFDGISDYETSGCISKNRYNDIFNKRLRDTHYQTYGATCAWTLASIRALRKLKKNAKTVKVPILLFQAEYDTTVKPEGQKYFAQKSKNTSLVIVPNSKHEIYNANSVIRKEYYKKIFDFINKY